MITIFGCTEGVGGQLKFQKAVQLEAAAKENEVMQIFKTGHRIGDKFHYSLPHYGFNHPPYHFPLRCILASFPPKANFYPNSALIIHQNLIEEQSNQFQKGIQKTFGNLNSIQVSMVINALIQKIHFIQKNHCNMPANLWTVKMSDQICLLSQSLECNDQVTGQVTMV